MNRKALTDMQKSTDVVHVLPEGTAQPLIDGGYVRAATIDPMPRNGIPVSLTALGRGFTGEVEQTPAKAV